MASSVSAAPAGAITIEAWADAVEDEPGELVRGAVEEEETTDRLHEACVRWLLVELALWARRSGAHVYGSELKLALGPDTGRKPDVSAWLAGTPRGAGSSTLQRALPDLVVEVASPRPRDQRRDRVEKATEYAAAGIRWYWMLDPRARTLEVLELGADGRYVRAVAETSGSVVIPGLADLSLDLDALWRELADEED